MYFISSDQKLFRDESDVKYCKSLNSCKVPQVKILKKKI